MVYQEMGLGTEGSQQRLDLVSRLQACIHPDVIRIRSTSRSEPLLSWYLDIRVDLNLDIQGSTLPQDAATKDEQDGAADQGMTYRTRREVSTHKLPACFPCHITCR